MIYVPVNVNKPIAVDKQITVQYGTTTNFPDIIFELHVGKEYFDLGDGCRVSACVTNTYQETVGFSGTVRVLNPHRGQIVCCPTAQDFTATGYNTMSILCIMEDGTEISFQTTIYVQSLSDKLLQYLI